MKEVAGIVTLILIGALLVLVVTHAGGFATDVAAGGTFIDNSAMLLTGNTSPGALSSYPTG